MAVCCVCGGVAAYVKPTGGKGGGVAEVGKVMAETTELMHERGEKLRNLADKTQQLQQVSGRRGGARGGDGDGLLMAVACGLYVWCQSAMDFQEMARQLAEREKNRKWWEF